MQFNSSDPPARRRLDPFIYRPGPVGGNSSDTPARHRLDPFICRPGSEGGSSPERPSVDSSSSVPGPEPDSSTDTTGMPRPDPSTGTPESEPGNSSDIPAGPQLDSSMSTSGPEQGNGLDIPARPRPNAFISIPWLEVDGSSDNPAKHWLDPFVQHPPSEHDNPYVPARRQLDILLYPPLTEQGNNAGVPAGPQPDPLINIPESKFGNSSEKGNGLSIPARPQLDPFLPFPGLDGVNSPESPPKRRYDPFIYRPGSERSRSSSRRRPRRSTVGPGLELSNSSDTSARSRLDRLIYLPGSERSSSLDSSARSRLDRSAGTSRRQERSSSEAPPRRRHDPFIYRPGSQRGKSLDHSAIPWLCPNTSAPGLEGGNSSGAPGKRRLDPITYRPGSARAPQPARPVGGRRSCVPEPSAGTRPGGDQGEDVHVPCFTLFPPPLAAPVPTFCLAEQRIHQPEDDESSLFPATPPEEEVWPHRALFFSPPSPLPDPPEDAEEPNPAPGTSGEADSVNPENEESSCWSNFSLAMLAGDQEETSAEQVGEDCEDEDDTASRRQEHEEPNPVVKLERYAYSDIVFNRQLVARNIVDTLRAVVDSQEAVDAVLTALGSLSLDCEPSVRTELVEQLPNIASFCASEGGLLENVVREHVVPILVQYLTDVANQVRKRTQVSLLFILERSLIDRKQLEEQICSLVVHLTESENVDDYRMEAVTLMTKMAPYLGKDTTAYLFLPRFISLCQDASFHLRKVCAANYGDFSSIVGQEYTEDNLPVFQMLCEDCVWGVRKACAEVFMPVSCVCSLVIRRSNLAPLFLCLLDDQSRWVRIAAFQALGPFISTFANPLRTGLYCSEDGVVSVRVCEHVSSDEEATSPAEAPVSLKGTGNQECAVATDLSPASDPVNCEKVGTIEDATSALLEKGEQQIAFDDDKEEPCRASSCMATVEDSCGYKDCAALLSMPEKLENATTGCSAEMVFEGSSIQKDVPGDQQACTETVGLKEALSVEGDQQRLVVHVDSGADSDFNTFQFWRVPIPELEVDIEFLGNRATAVHVRAKSQSQGNRCFSSDLSVEVLGDNGKPINASGVLHLNQDSGISSQRPSGDSTLRIRTASLSSLTSADQECNVLLSSSVTEASVAFNEAGEVAGVHKVRMSNSKEVAGTENTLLAKSLNDDSDCWPAHRQDIVPVALLERYQSMTDPTLAQNLDSEIGRHCAHSLPAVALTLGRQYWPCLRSTYRSLVSDVQWKVRHIVASCLHELATILGPQIASQDLVPSFEGFVRDVDEVRVGLLERLALFLRGLSKADQRRLLPLLADFLCMDNHRNWRFRHTLGRQLKEIAALYDPSDVNQYLVPIVTELLVDKVAEVRHMAVEAMVAVLKQLGPHYLMCKEVLQQLCAKVQDRMWSQRQLFCELAEQMVSSECLSEEEFIGTVLPKLLYLCHDSVPNVRMALARCLVRGIWPKAFIWGSGNLYKDELKATLAFLQEDTDRDVRFCAQLYPKDSVD